LHVTLNIPVEFRKPKLSPRLREYRIAAMLMTVPKASMNENCKPEPWQDDIRASRKLLSSEGKPKSEPMQQ